MKRKDEEGWWWRIIIWDKEDWEGWGRIITWDKEGEEGWIRMRKDDEGWGRIITWDEEDGEGWGSWPFSGKRKERMFPIFSEKNSISFYINQINNLFFKFI